MATVPKTNNDQNPDIDQLSLSSTATTTTATTTSSSTSNDSAPFKFQKVSTSNDPLFRHKSHSMPPLQSHHHDGGDHGDVDEEEEKGDSVSTAAYSLATNTYSAAYNYMTSFYGPSQSQNGDPILTADSKRDLKSKSLSAIKRIDGDDVESRKSVGSPRALNGSQSEPQNEEKKWMEPDLINYPLRSVFCTFLEADSVVV